MIDPLFLLLKDSSPLRQVAEATNDPEELKKIIFELAAGFDRMRALMPTPSCVLLEDLAEQVRATYPLHVLPPREHAG